MSASAPNPRPGRYTPPGEDVELTSRRPMIIKVVAGLVIVALVLAPISFLFFYFF